MEKDLNKKRYKLTFNYTFMDNMDYLLADTKILQKSFEENEVAYVIETTEEGFYHLFPLLLTITSRQIKIDDLTPKNVDPGEPGTDKPLGSKAAIDEN